MPPLHAFKDHEGKYTPYTDGGYPVVYYDNENQTLCAACANKEGMSTEVVAADIFYEGSPERCCDCNMPIKSAYGDPDAPDLGEPFKLTDDAIDHHGEQYRDKIYTVSAVYDHYVPEHEFYNPEHPRYHEYEGHPEYKEQIGENLYEADGLPFKVQAWEVEKI